MGSIRVTSLGKAYKQYPSRWSRLAEWMLPFRGTRHQLKWVLRDIHFQVSAGEAVGIIGINGAGKSTLLKLITGTILPTTGQVEISGRTAALLELGMGFHSDFTGRQNAYMAGQLTGLSNAEMNDLMPQIEAFAEIGDYIDQPVRVYSSGMQVRLAFSVATAVRPDILIVDEALAVGDVFFQQKCFARIRAFQEAGTTLLFVSHAMSSVYSLCDRAILIADGRIALDDKPKAVIDLYNARMIQLANPNPDALKVLGGKESPDPENPEQKSLSEPAKTAGKTELQGQNSVGSYTTKGVEIESVKLLNAGQEVESFVSENEVTLRIGVKFSAPYPDPHVGIQIRDNRGEAIFMTNTYAMRQSIGPVQAGNRVEVDFICQPALAEGQYTLTAGVANEGMQQSDFGESLTRLQNAHAFTVLRNYDSIYWAGVYNLSPQCKIRLES